MNELLLAEALTKKFQFMEDPLLGRLDQNIRPIIFLLSLSIGMLLLANRRLKAISPIIY
jgi:hypothetical protein